MKKHCRYLGRTFYLLTKLVEKKTHEQSLRMNYLMVGYFLMFHAWFESADIDILLHLCSTILMHKYQTSHKLDILAVKSYIL